jgi:drug/metabolite transporter (DMT)-like permease
MGKELKKGIFWIFLATLGFSVIPILAKLGFRIGLSSATLLFYRFLIAFLAFAVFLKVNGASLKLERRNAAKVLAAGLIYAVQCFCYFTAFKYIPASIGAILFNCYPIFVISLSRVFLKDPITKNKVVGVITAIAGTAVLLYAKWETPQITGLVLIILTAFISSVYMVYNKKYTADLNDAVLTMYICLICTVCFFVCSVASGEFVLLADASSWINVILLAVWSTIIGLYGFMRAISLLNVGLVSVVNLTEPIFTVVLSYIILSENLSAQQIGGGAIVILGIYFYENAPGRGRAAG